MSKKTNRIIFKATNEEKELLQKKAIKANKNMSEFLRDSILFTQVVEIDKTFQKRQLFLLNNIANNMNQIAHHCNIKKKVDENILKILDDFHENLKKAIRS